MDVSYFSAFIFLTSSSSPPDNQRFPAAAWTQAWRLSALQVAEPFSHAKFLCYIDTGRVFMLDVFSFSCLLPQGILLPKTASSAQDAGLQDGQPAQVHGQKSDGGDPVRQSVRKKPLENCITVTAHEREAAAADLSPLQKH